MNGWLKKQAGSSKALQSSIRLSRPQHPHPPGSPKQCQELHTGQRRAQNTAWPSLPQTPCQIHGWSKGMQEALTEGPLNCITKPSPSLAQPAGGCCVISAICLLALPSSALPGFAQRLLPAFRELCWVSVNKPQAGMGWGG